MNSKYKIPFALTILTIALMGCSSNKVKVEKVKPNALPKIEQTRSLAPVFSQSVSASENGDILRSGVTSANGVIFTFDPKGEVAAYQGKQRLWEKRISKQGLSSGITAENGLVFVGDKKGRLFAIDQNTGEIQWQAQLTGAILAPSLVQTERVITVANDGTVFAHDVASGKQVWTYNLPSEQLSLRHQAAPIRLDPRTVLIAASNAYVYAIDSITGIPRMQRRVAISDGRSDIQRLIDLGEPNIAGQFLVTTSYQGQLTVMDLASQQVVWSDPISSIQRPEIYGDKIIVAQEDGKLAAFEITTGQKVWENDQLLNRQLSNPVVLGQDLVVGDLDGILHVLDPQSGQLLGRSKTSGEVSSLRVIDNQLFVSTRKGALSVWQNR